MNKKPERKKLKYNDLKKYFTLLIYGDEDLIEEYIKIEDSIINLKDFKKNESTLKIKYLKHKNITDEELNLIGKNKAHIGSIIILDLSKENFNIESIIEEYKKYINPLFLLHFKYNSDIEKLLNLESFIKEEILPIKIETRNFDLKIKKQIENYIVNIVELSNRNSSKIKPFKFLKSKKTLAINLEDNWIYKDLIRKFIFSYIYENKDLYKNKEERIDCYLGFPPSHIYKRFKDKLNKEFEECKIKYLKSIKKDIESKNKKNNKKKNEIFKRFFLIKEKEIESLAWQLGKIEFSNNFCDKKIKIMPRFKLYFGNYFDNNINKNLFEKHLIKVKEYFEKNYEKIYLKNSTIVNIPIKKLPLNNNNEDIDNEENLGKKSKFLKNLAKRLMNSYYKDISPGFLKLITGKANNEDLRFINDSIVEEIEKWKEIKKYQLKNFPRFTNESIRDKINDKSQLNSLAKLNTMKDLNHLKICYIYQQDFNTAKDLVKNSFKHKSIVLQTFFKFNVDIQIQNLGFAFI